MWLLLVAAGTGYLARYWQKSRKFKTGPGILKCNAALHASQGSPSCTPRRGRSTTTLGRRVLRKRSRSARGVGRKLLHGRKEGKLATTQARGSDENLGAPDEVFDKLLCGEDFEKSHNELFLTTVCAQDHLRETFSCMEKPLLSTAEIDAKDFLFCDSVLPIEKGSSNGGTTTRLDFANIQLGVASSSSNSINSAKLVQNDSLVGATIGQLVQSCPEILGVKTLRQERRLSLPLKLKNLTEQAFHFSAKVARGFGRSKFHGSSSLKSGFVLNTRDAHGFKYPLYGKSYNKTLLEQKKIEQRFDPYFVNSQHLKALLDSEIFDHCQRCGHLPFLSSSYDVEKGFTYSADFSGLGMAKNQRLAHADKVSSGWVHSPENAPESAKTINPFTTSKSERLCSKENCLHSFNVPFFALGVAMGVLLVTSGRSGELEDLHKLLKKHSALIEELRKQIDSRFELDPLKLPDVQKVPSGLTVANGTCSRKAHLHPDISSSNSAGEKGFLELFDASNNHAGRHEYIKSHTGWFDDLEAELEAELQLIELNGCNTDLAGQEWKGTELNQEGWQPKGDGNGYLVQPEGGDDTSYVDTDIHDSAALQDAGQVYESDFVVPPLELERRLWQVLEQRHEERICELENDIRVMQEKVTAKEMEAQWWKDHAVAPLGGDSDP